jgi:hypothetical protein
MHAWGIVLTALVGVFPDEAPDNHAQPAHYGALTLRTFEQEPVDTPRRTNWEAYCYELDRLWVDYREAGSTLEAWKEYKHAADHAKRRYVYHDPYLMPIEHDPEYRSGAKSVEPLGPPVVTNYRAIRGHFWQPRPAEAPMGEHPWRLSPRIELYPILGGPSTRAKVYIP